MQNIENLVTVKKNEAVCTSLDVAEKFHKRHDRVLRAIEDLKIYSPQNWGQSFKKSIYRDRSGKSNKMYYMNRDGFAILAMGFTGKDAVEWKWKYINAFNKMESIIAERKTVEWQQARQNGKDIRLQETDTIKKLVEYAKEQGSEHANKLYLVYTRLAKRIVNGCRDEIECMELIHLTNIERLILDSIQYGMAQCMDYKGIYQICKERLEEYERISTTRYFLKTGMN